MKILTEAMASADRWRHRLLGARGPGAAPSTLTAVSLSPTPALVQVRAVEPAAGTGAVAWQLVAARRARAGTQPLAELKNWQREGLLPRRGAVLVLGGADRYVQSLDRPAVPDNEIALAVRWPLAEAMEAEPEDLLVTALALMPVNESGRQQVLAVAGRTAVVKAQLAVLAQAGVKVTHVDVVESALRGLALLHARADVGSIVLLTLGSELAVGLVWKGELCAVRSLPLPALHERESAAWVDQLALQVQRTADHYERQATQLAVREVLACLPDLTPPERMALCSAVALPTREVRALTSAGAEEGGAAQVQADETSDSLAALACVGVVRLAERLAELAKQAPQANAADTPRPAASTQAPEAGMPGEPAVKAPPTPAEAAAQALAQAALGGPARTAEPQPTPSKTMEWTP